LQKIIRKKFGKKYTFLEFSIKEFSKKFFYRKYLEDKKKNIFLLENNRLLSNIIKMNNKQNFLKVSSFCFIKTKTNFFISKNILTNSSYIHNSLKTDSSLLCFKYETLSDSFKEWNRSMIRKSNLYNKNFFRFCFTKPTNKKDFMLYWIFPLVGFVISSLYPYLIDRGVPHVPPVSGGGVGGWNPKINSKFFFSNLETRNFLFNISSSLKQKDNIRPFYSVKHIVFEKIQKEPNYSSNLFSLSQREFSSPLRDQSINDFYFDFLQKKIFLYNNSNIEYFHYIVPISNQKCLFWQSSLFLSNIEKFQQYFFLSNCPKKISFNDLSVLYNQNPISIMNKAKIISNIEFHESASPFYLDNIEEVAMSNTVQKSSILSSIEFQKNPEIKKVFSILDSLSYKKMKINLLNNLYLIDSTIFFNSLNKNSSFYFFYNFLIPPLDSYPPVGGVGVGGIPIRPDSSLPLLYPPRAGRAVPLRYPPVRGGRAEGKYESPLPPRAGGGKEKTNFPFSKNYIEKFFVQKKSKYFLMDKYQKFLFYFLKMKYFLYNITNLKKSNSIFFKKSLSMNNIHFVLSNNLSLKVLAKKNIQNKIQMKNFQKYHFIEALEDKNYQKNLLFHRTGLVPNKIFQTILSSSMLFYLIDILSDNVSNMKHYPIEFFNYYLIENPPTPPPDTGGTCGGREKILSSIYPQNNHIKNNSLYNFSKNNNALNMETLRLFILNFYKFLSDNVSSPPPYGGGRGAKHNKIEKLLFLSPKNTSNILLDKNFFQSNKPKLVSKEKLFRAFSSSKYIPNNNFDKSFIFTILANKQKSQLVLFVQKLYNIQKKKTILDKIFALPPTGGGGGYQTFIQNRILLDNFPKFSKKNTKKNFSITCFLNRFVFLSNKKGDFELSNKRKFVEKQKYFQKKRRRKKLKLENRRRKKRKRFYPRPIWLRYSLYRKYIHNRYNKNYFSKNFSIPPGGRGRLQNYINRNNRQKWGSFSLDPIFLEKKGFEKTLFEIPIYFLSNIENYSTLDNIEIILFQNKSNWLRSNLQPYIDRMKKNLRHLLSIPFVCPPPYCPSSPRTGGVGGRNEQEFLKRLDRKKSVFDYFSKNSKNYSKTPLFFYSNKKMSFQKIHDFYFSNMQLLENRRFIAEYDRILFDRISEILLSKNNIEHSIIYSKLPKSKYSNFLQNPIVSKSNNLFHRLKSSMFQQLDPEFSFFSIFNIASLNSEKSSVLKPYGSNATLRVLWAFNKTNLFSFQEKNNIQYLWEIQKKREQLKSNSTKKWLSKLYNRISNFLAKKNLDLYKSNHLCKIFMKYENIQKKLFFLSNSVSYIETQSNSVSSSPPYGGGRGAKHYLIEKFQRKTFQKPLFKKSSSFFWWSNYKTANKFDGLTFCQSTRPPTPVVPHHHHPPMGGVVPYGGVPIRGVRRGGGAGVTNGFFYYLNCIDILALFFHLCLFIHFLRIPEIRSFLKFQCAFIYKFFHFSFIFLNYRIESVFLSNIGFFKNNTPNFRPPPYGGGRGTFNQNQSKIRRIDNLSIQQHKISKFQIYYFQNSFFNNFRQTFPTLPLPLPYLIDRGTTRTPRWGRGAGRSGTNRDRKFFSIFFFASEKKIQKSIFSNQKKYYSYTKNIRWDNQKFLSDNVSYMKHYPIDYNTKISNSRLFSNMIEKNRSPRRGVENQNYLSIHPMLSRIIFYKWMIVFLFYLQLSSTVFRYLIEILENLFFIIYKFLEKPAELMIESIAQFFFIEWMSDLCTFIPEILDQNIWESFQKYSRPIRILGFWAGSYPYLWIFLYNIKTFFKIFFHELWDSFFKPDMDVYSRQKKGIYYMNIWGEIFIQAAEKYQMNVASLVTIPVEQEKFMENLLKDSDIFSLDLLYNKILSNPFYKIDNNKIKKNYDLIEKKSLFSINQHFLSNNQSIFFDLFLDISPPKSFQSISSFSMSFILGPILCEVYSGLFPQKVSKNLLLITKKPNKQNYLIEALAGETEMKFILDNAERYVVHFSNKAIGMRLLKDVFVNIALQTPSFYLIEDIHFIGEKRSLSDKERNDLSSPSPPGGGGGGENQDIYPVNRMKISDSKRRKNTSSEYKNFFHFQKKHPLSFLFGSTKHLKSAPLRGDENKNYSIKTVSRLKKTSETFFIPTSTSPNFSSKNPIKPKARFPIISIEKNNDFSFCFPPGPSLPPHGGVGGGQYGGGKGTQTIKAKIAKLAEKTFQYFSGSLDMITDLLVIIDSVRSNRGFVVFATTPIPSVLDPALRRPGRFDESFYLPEFSIKNMTIEFFSDFPSIYLFNNKYETSLFYTALPAHRRWAGRGGYPSLYPYLIDIGVPYGEGEGAVWKSQPKKNYTSYKIDFFYSISKNLFFDFSQKQSSNFMLSKNNTQKLSNCVSYMKHYPIEKILSSPDSYPPVGGVGVEGEKFSIHKISLYKIQNSVQTFIHPFTILCVLLENSLEPEFSFLVPKVFYFLYGYSIEKQRFFLSYSSLKNSLFFYKIKCYSIQKNVLSILDSFLPVPAPVRGREGMELTGLFFEILMPTKKYEAFKSTENIFLYKNSFSLYEKIHIHQKQRFFKKLYNQPIQFYFQSHTKFQDFTTFTNSFKELGFHLPAIKGSSTNYYSKTRFFMRHCFSLTNQWWNAHLPEHNMESTFLSDVDWRSMYVQSKKLMRLYPQTGCVFTSKNRTEKDLFFDFSDADQQYNPRIRKWIFYPYSNKFDFQNLFYYEIYYHLFMQSFYQIFYKIEKNRELLDSFFYNFLFL